MRRPLLINFLFAFLAFAITGYITVADTTHSHVVIQENEVKWVDAPHLGPGVQSAVLEGDPASSGAYTLRIKTPDGFKVPPHWHPMDENLLVIEGTFMVGMGEKFDPSALQSMTAGGYAFVPKEMRHFAMSKGETIVQVYGNGPFQVIYVNPADDPSKKMGSK